MTCTTIGLLLHVQDPPEHIQWLWFCFAVLICELCLSSIAGSPAPEAPAQPPPALPPSPADLSMLPRDSTVLTYVRGARRLAHHPPCQPPSPADFTMLPGDSTVLTYVRGARRLSQLPTAAPAKRADFSVLQPDSAASTFVRPVQKLQHQPAPEDTCEAGREVDHKQGRKLFGRLACAHVRCRPLLVAALATAAGVAAHVLLAGGRGVRR